MTWKSVQNYFSMENEKVSLMNLSFWRTKNFKLLSSTKNWKSHLSCHINNFYSTWFCFLQFFAFKTVKFNNFPNDIRKILTGVLNLKNCKKTKSSWIKIIYITWIIFNVFSVKCDFQFSVELKSLKLFVIQNVKFIKEIFLFSIGK